jgi:hypothetical protein
MGLMTIGGVNAGKSCWNLVVVSLKSDVPVDFDKHQKHADVWKMFPEDCRGGWT